jgi:DNA (cytosine-5)-methyltransferase 1
MMRVLDLFSGIGGFSLGLERTGGFKTVAFCEIEPFPRRVLAKHWPGVPIYEDVRTLTADRLAADGIAVDVITGGFPCQDLSVAGKQRGMGEGTRSGLWSEIVRLTRELRPQFVIVENVAALLAGPSERRGGWFGRVLGDLAECGYDAEWENIPASALGAPHRRERVWLVAYAQQDGCDAATFGRGADACLIKGRLQELEGYNRSPGDVPHPAQLLGNGGDDYAGKRLERGPLSELGNSGWQKYLAHADIIHEQGQQPSIFDAQGWAGQIAGPPRRLAGIGWEWRLEPDVGRVAHGVPNRSHRLSALGNAVVPQIPELIGRAILASLKERQINEVST